MFNEAIFNLINIGLALAVIIVGYGAAQKVSGKVKTVVNYILFSAVVLGIAELIDMLQLAADGTLLANIIYEKEILVLVFLLLAVLAVKKGGKK